MEKLYILSYFNYRSFQWINIIGLLISILSPFAIFASGYRLTIINEDKQKLSDVVVNVLAYNDSTIIQYLISDSNGNIDLSDSLNQMDLIYVNRPDYETIRIRYNELKDTLKLKSSAKDLKELVVLGNKDHIRAEAGKVIFTPGDLKTKVNTAYDLMKYVPLISEEHDVFKILDKVAYILIDGMEPQIPQQQILEALRSTHPSRIKSIEIKPNPGSEYSASSNIGIININLVDKRNGFWSSVRVNGAAGDGDFIDMNNINIFYSQARFRISANGSFLTSLSGKKQSDSFLYGGNDEQNYINISNQSRSKKRYYNSGGALFMSYDLTKNSKIGGGITMYALKNIDTYTTTSIYSKADGPEQTSTSISRYVQPWTKPLLDYTLYYVINTDKKGSRLEVSGIYSHGNTEAHTYYDFAPENNEYRGYSDKGGSVNARYTHVFTSNQTLKGGYGFNTTKHSDISQTPLRCYSFDYNETIHAAFLQLESIWKYGFSSSVGMRLEHDKIEGAFSNGTMLYNRTETGFFPSLSLNYSLPSGNHYWMLEVVRRIHRPQFSDLNPYILWTSENTCIAGNPELKSTKAWNISLMYMFLQHYILRLSYSWDKDANMLFEYGENGVSFTTRINRPKTRYYSFLFDFNKDLMNVWRIKANTNVFYHYVPFIFHGKDLTEKALGVICNFQNHFSFRGKYTPFIDFNAQAGFMQQFAGLGEHFFLNTTLSFSKELFKNFNADVSLTWDALSRHTVKTMMQDYQRNAKNLSLPLTAYFSFIYTFGNSGLRRYQDEGDNSYKNRF